MQQIDRRMKLSCSHDAQLPSALEGYDPAGFPADDLFGERLAAYYSKPVHPDPAWFALFVRTGHEEAIRACIQHLYPDLKTLVPTREVREYTRGEWRTVVKRLLPGYLFFYTLLTPEFCHRLRGFAHVIRICGAGWKPLPIEEEQAGILLQLVRQGDLIRFSRIYKSGERVVVESGPLKGMEGIIERCDVRKKRVRIRLSIDGEVKLLDLAAEYLEEEETERGRTAVMQLKAACS
jgi:transcriptional antiterminator NusG